jgi:peptidoglycan hydrolase-like protein with peptidoglycan-binding domain
MAWRLARSLQQLQRELDQRFPRRVKPDWTIGDPAHRARASDHNPRADGVVCAIDVRGRDTAAWLFDHLRRARDARVKYIIFNRQIVSSTNSPWTVRSYGGSNPHADHIHISVGRGPDGRSTGPVDDASPWGITSASSPAPSPPPATGGSVLRRGSRGKAVRDWQTILRGAGHQLAADGIFGPATEQATRAFQAKLGVTADGIVGPQTRAAVDRLFRYLAGQQAPAFPGTVRMGDRGAAVRTWQQALAGRGYQLVVDGIFGPATNHVVRDWQRNHGLAVDGIAGPATWRSLTGG